VRHEHLPFVILAVVAFLPLAVLAIQIIIKLITKSADLDMQDASDTILQKPLQPKWRRLIYGLLAFYVLLSIMVTAWAVGMLLNPSGSSATYIFRGNRFSRHCGSRYLASVFE
jgi:uncharacterized membrane protein YjgN (DUF898 family)